MPEVLDRKEIHSLLLDILIDVDSFCREHKLRYSLAYGTLLGAVRHKGFIPWDDDIDIMMPREDFNFFIKEYNDRGRFRCLYNARGKFVSCYAKVEDITTTSIEKYREGVYDFGLNIDIFPVDSAPDDRALQPVFAHDVARIRRRLLLSQRPFFPFSFHIPLFALIEAHKKSTEQWYAECMEKITEYNSSETGWKGPVSGGMGMIEIYPREMFEEYIELEFEGRNFMSVKDWHHFLEQQFGDYMQLPPENKRKTHGLKVYRKS